MKYIVKGGGTDHMPQRTQYTVEAILIEGDGVPDGDLVTKYVNGKVKARMFVPVKSLQVLVRTHSLSMGVTVPKQRIVYAKIPPIETNDKQVVVQGTSKFGQLVQKGGGEQAGAMGMTAIVQALVALFAG
jgi:hypothetical protein